MDLSTVLFWGCAALAAAFAIRNLWLQGEIKGWQGATSDYRELVDDTPDVGVASILAALNMNAQKRGIREGSFENLLRAVEAWG